MGAKLFGTDGVRGKANIYPMTAEFALRLATAAGQLVCNKERRVAIGRDTRLSGEMLEAAMIAGFTALPAIIFDEVDTGVSGDIADKMGDIMQELGTKMQVFAITHLPQIAAKGKDHYFVYKEDTDERTVTRIRKMNKEERVKEIARMLSGASLTSASIANAKELLKSKI